MHVEHVEHKCNIVHNFFCQWDLCGRCHICFQIGRKGRFSHVNNDRLIRVFVSFDKFLVGYDCECAWFSILVLPWSCVITWCVDGMAELSGLVDGPNVLYFSTLSYSSSSRIPCFFLVVGSTIPLTSCFNLQSWSWQWVRAFPKSSHDIPNWQEAQRPRKILPRGNSWIFFALPSCWARWHSHQPLVYWHLLSGTLVWSLWSINGTIWESWLKCIISRNETFVKEFFSQGYLGCFALLELSRLFPFYS